MRQERHSSGLLFCTVCHAAGRTPRRGRKWYWLPCYWRRCDVGHHAADGVRHGRLKTHATTTCAWLCVWRRGVASERGRHAKPTILQRSRPCADLRGRRPRGRCGRRSVRSRCMSGSRVAIGDCLWSQLGRMEWRLTMWRGWRQVHATGGCGERPSTVIQWRRVALVQADVMYTAALQHTPTSHRGMPTEHSNASGWEQYEHGSRRSHQGVQQLWSLQERQ